ncbi:MAG: hypothetical protein ACTSW1_11150 [Candidatus Hodarchaeales archaeon]
MTSQKNVGTKVNYKIPFSLVGKFLQLILALSIIFCFALWAYITFSVNVNILLLYILFTMILFSYCLIAVLVLSISGSGFSELIIMSDSIILKHVFNPFFTNYFRRETLRRASIKDIQFLESSSQSSPNWVLIFIGFMSFLIGFFIIPFGSIFQLDFSFLPLIFIITGVFLNLYSIFFTKKKFYQFKIVLNRPGLFFPFFEFIGHHFTSSGIWIIRGHLGDAKKLYEEGQQMISSQQSE